MTTIVPFPVREPSPVANENDTGGPAVGATAWRCIPCTDESDADSAFAFYVTPGGVHCWTCHAVQYFP